MYDIEAIKQKTLITREEGAALLGVCRNTMQKYMHAEGFPELVKVGRLLFINRPEMEKWHKQKSKIKKE